MLTKFEISKTFKKVYQTLYEKTSLKNETESFWLIAFWIELKLQSSKTKSCEKEITESDLYNAIKSMVNNKSPGNDGLTTGFYETFWDQIIDLFHKSVKDVKRKKQIERFTKASCHKVNWAKW